MKNRELKFRVWCPLRKRFALNTEDGYIYQVEDFRNGEFWVGCGDDGVIQQSTGLKDKDGREIYEGDIVTYRLSESTSDYSLVRFIVTWGDCGWRMDDIDLKCCVGYLTVAIKSYEIIGNVFENPELLEVAR